MMVHVHPAEERICDSCARRSVVFDVRAGRTERGLSLCLKCFRDFTSTLVEAASRIRGNLEAAPPAAGKLRPVVSHS